MTEKELLEHRKKHQQVRMYALLVRELERTIGYTPLVFGDASPHGGAAESSQVERLADKLIQTKKRYHDLVADWEAEQRKVEDILLRLPQEEGQVLLAYYGSLSTWPQIADAFGYSERHIYRLRKQGIERLERETSGSGTPPDTEKPAEMC